MDLSLAWPVTLFTWQFSKPADFLSLLHQFSKPASLKAVADVAMQLGV